MNQKLHINLQRQLWHKCLLPQKPHSIVNFHELEKTAANLRDIYQNFVLLNCELNFAVKFKNTFKKKSLSERNTFPFSQVALKVCKLMSRKTGC